MIMEPYTEPFWEALRDDTFLIHASEECGARFFPPSPLCPHCHSSAVTWHESEAVGTLYSFTRTHATAEPFDDELVVGVVELAEGPKLLAPIDEPYESLRIGAEVRLEAEPYEVDYDRGWLSSYPFFVARTLAE